VYGGREELGATDEGCTDDVAFRVEGERWDCCDVCWR